MTTPWSPATEVDHAAAQRTVLGDLDEALRALTDDGVVDLLARLRGVARALAAEPSDGPPARGRPARAAWFMSQFVEYEQHRREELAKHARVELDANGHEVWLSHEIHGRDGTHIWTAFCSCAENGITRDGAPLAPGDLASSDLPSYEVAVEVAAEHAAVHGGAWEPGHPDPDLPPPPL